MKAAPLPYIESHSALRGIAALVVLLDHLRANGVLPKQGILGRVFQLVAWNDLAVFLFFVLSGFVMSYIYPSPVRWRHFLAARLARLLPVYEVTLVVSLAFMLVNSGRGSTTVLNVIANALTIQAWLPMPHWFPINFPSWSLSVETFLYLFAFPLLVYSRAHSSNKFLYLLLIVIGATWGTVFYNDYRPYLFRVWGFPLLCGLTGFGAGFSIQGLMGKQLHFPGTMAVAGGLLISLSLIYRVVFPLATGHGLLMFGLILIVVSSVDPNGLPYRILARPPLLFLGDISYSLYLWHLSVLYFILHGGNHILMSLQSAWAISMYHVVVTILDVVLPLVVATLSYYQLEVPLRKWIRDRCVRPTAGAVLISA